MITQTQTILSKRIVLLGAAMLLLVSALISVVTIGSQVSFAAAEPYAYNATLGKKAGFQAPADVVLDAQGNMYIVSVDPTSDTATVVKLSPGGSVLQTYNGNSGAFSAASSVAVDGNGVLFVADAGNNRVQRFNQSGVFISQFGAAGTGNSQFNRPSGIAVVRGTGTTADGAVYVVDSGNNRVQIFTNEGTYSSQFGTKGEGDGQFQNAKNITILSNGQVVVLDNGYSGGSSPAGGFARAQRFTSSGVYLDQYGSYGSGNGQFRFPTGIASDDNYIYIGDPRAGKVVKFSKADKSSTDVVVPEAASPTQAFALRVESGKLYVAASLGNRIDVMSPTGSAITEYGAARGTFVQPIAISDQGGNVYVLDSDWVQVFDGTNTFVRQLKLASTPGGQLTGAAGMAIGPGNRLYVVDSQTPRVLVFDTNGNYLSQFGSADLQQPLRIATDTSGNVYVTNGSDVKKFNSRGTLLTTIGSGGQAIYDVRVDADGNIYTIDVGSNKVAVYSAAGAPVREFGAAGSGNGQFNTPAAVAISPAGNVYVTDTGNNRVQVFDGTGTYLTQKGKLGSDNASFNSPLYLAFDANQRLLVADTSNGRVQIYTNPDKPADGITATAEAAQDSITVNWQPTPGAVYDGYRLKARKAGTDQWIPLTTVSGTTRSYSFSMLGGQPLEQGVEYEIGIIGIYLDSETEIVIVRTTLATNVTPVVPEVPNTSLAH